MPEESQQQTQESQDTQTQEMQELPQENPDSWSVIPFTNTSDDTSDVSLTIGDLFLFQLDPSKSPRTDTFLTKLVEIVKQDMTAHFEDENGEIIVFACEELSTDDSSESFRILYETPGYKILDMAVIYRYDPEITPFQDMELETVDDEISVSVSQNNVYSQEVQRDDILFQYIRSLGIYDQPFLIQRAHESIAHLTQMISEGSEPLSDSLIPITPGKLPNFLTPLLDESVYVLPDQGLSYIEETFNIRSMNYSESIDFQLRHENILDGDLSNGSGFVTNEYSGTYLLDCLQTASCRGIDGMYMYDERRHPSSIQIPVFTRNELGEDNTHFVEIYTPPQIKIASVLEEPYDKVYYGLYENTTLLFPLRERMEIHLDYDMRKHGIRNTLKEAQIVGHIAGPTTLREVNGQYFVSHRLSERNTADSFSETLRNNISQASDIISYFTEKGAYNTCRNYDDLLPTLYKYGLSYEKLLPSVRKPLAVMIQKYVNQQRGVSVKRETSVESLIKRLSIGEKIKRARDFILSVTNVQEKNELLSEFIRVYTRESDKSNEDNNYLYNKYANEKLLCKHYRYLVQVKNDNTVFETMVTIYGDTPRDGKICCQVCGEYICEEEASLHEGFSDGVPMQSRSVMDPIDTSEQIKRQEFLDSNETEVERLTVLSSAIGVELTPDMLYDILKTDSQVDSNELQMVRYNMPANSEHPRVSKMLAEIKKKEKQTKDKKQKKSLKRQKEQIITEFINWLKDTRKALVYLSLISVFIQTAVPSLNLKNNVEFRVIDTHTGGFRDATIQYLEKKLQRVCENYKTDPFWRKSMGLFTEPAESVSLTLQLKNTITYLLSASFPDVRRRVKLYDEFTEFDKGLYLKPEWTLFKPHSQNSLNQSVNQCVMKGLHTESLRRVVRGYLIENVSLIRPISNGIRTLSQLCEIPSLQIIQNPSFQRLFQTTVSCYGNHPNHIKFTILIHQLLASSGESEQIRSILQRNGWNPKSEGFPSLDFYKWRNKIIPDILGLSSKEGSSHIQSCYPNPVACNSFIHRMVNNFNYSLLNTYPKRVYGYIPPSVFPEKPYKLLEEFYPELLQSLFESYRVNVVGDIVKHKSSENPCDRFFLSSMSDNDRLSTGSMKHMTQDEDHFQKLLTLKRKRGSLEYRSTFPIIQHYTKDDYQLTTQSHIVGNYRLIQWIDMHSRKNSKDETWTDIHQRIKKCMSEQSDSPAISKSIQTVFSQLLEYQNECIDIVCQFLSQSSEIDNERRNRLSKLFGIKYTSDNLVKIMQTYLKQCQVSDIQTSLTECNQLLSLTTGSVFSTTSRAEDVNNRPMNIPNRWNLTPKTTEGIHKFLARSLYDEHTVVPSSWLIHDYQMNPNSRKYQVGFESYALNDIDSCVYLTGLHNYLQDELIHSELLRGDNHSKYTQKLSMIYYRFQLAYVLSEIVRYIQDLRDTQSDVSLDANLLFSSLENETEEHIQRSVHICSLFLMDFVTHLFMTHYDPKWLYMNRGESLEKQLAKQKEREKGERIRQLDSAAGSEEREIMTAKQEAGLTNWFREAEENARNYVGNAEWEQASKEDRDMILQTIFENAGLDREDTPMDLPSVLPAPPTEEQIEEHNGYDYVSAMDDEPEDVDGLANPEENLQEDFYQEFNE